MQKITLRVQLSQKNCPISLFVNFMHHDFFPQFFLFDANKVCESIPLSALIIRIYLNLANSPYHRRGGGGGGIIRRERPNLRKLSINQRPFICPKLTGFIAFFFRYLNSYDWLKKFRAFRFLRIRDCPYHQPLSQPACRCFSV